MKSDGADGKQSVGTKGNIVVAAGKLKDPN